MQKHAPLKAVTMAIILVILFTLSIIAQEHRRIQPAFPIGAGEKMLVYSAGSFIDAAGSSDVEKVLFSSYVKWPLASTDMIRHQIILPVGATLKRMILDVADTSSGPNGNIHIYLVRYNNSDGQTRITLRNTNTSGILSSSITDFKQVVTNPMSHVMLQGWSYYVEIYSDGLMGNNEHAFSAAKIIYEP